VAVKQFQVKDGDDGKLDRFLRRQGYQQFRIKLLLECGGIRKTTGPTLQTLQSEDQRVQVGDVVTVDMNARYEERLADLTDDDFRDYVFGIATDPIVNRAATMLARDKRRIWLNEADTVSGFFKALRTSPQLEYPVRDLFIVSHATPSGLLFTHLDLTARGVINFEDLEVVEKSKSVFIEPATIQPRPKDNSGAARPVTLRIHGCTIGEERTRPFLEKLREVTGAGAVVASKHFDATAELKSGLIDYRLYAFTVTSRIPITDRKVLEKAFREGGFKAVTGEPVSKQMWDAWFKAMPVVKISPDTTTPEAVHRVIFRVSAKSPTPLINIATVGAEYLFYPTKFFKDDLFVVAPEWPRDEAKRLELVRALLITAPVWTANHPFPIYKRYGFDTLDDFIAGVHWSWRRDDPKIIFQAIGYIYQLRLPVVDWKSKKLFANYYPNPPKDKGKPPMENFIGIDQDDPRFHGRAARGPGK
jgi:hypothetical protein